MGTTTKKGHHRVYGSAISVLSGRPAMTTARPPLARKASSVTGAPKTPTPSKEELIDALAVLAGTPSDEEKAAALDKLSAYFNAMLAATDSAKQEKLSAVRESLRDLTARVAKVERASARVTLSRVAARSAALRQPRDGVIEMIARAERNTRTGLHSRTKGRG